MRLRLYSSSLQRRRASILPRKQRMESRRREKRKSPSKDIIFELSDGDVSSGPPSDEDCSEPNAKILKTDGNNFQLTSNEDSNPKSDKQNSSPKNSPNPQSQDDSVVIIDCNSLSNNNTIEILSGNDDIIDITIGDTDTPNINEERCSKANEDSVDANVIVDITEESRSPLKEEDFNLEEGELKDIPNEDQLDSSKYKLHICITFSDEEIAENYKSKFLNFIQSFIEFDVKNCEGLTINVQQDPTINPSEWVVVDETLCLEVPKVVEEENIIAPLLSLLDKSPSKKKKKKNKKDKQLFILDTNPCEDANSKQHTKYSSKFQIDINEKTPEEDQKEVKISAQTCFNCDSSHAIKDCPKPKDYARINAARQRFKAQKQTARYHMEEDQKYSHLSPGKISDKLKQALGLRKNQLPPYIYKMRVLGYPPGWLEEAKFVNSNLEMFDSEGKNVQGSSSRKRQGLDPEGIVDYPGFNMPVPRDLKDECRQYNVPPFSANFSKEAMIDFFEKQYAAQQDDLEACDMDLDSTFEENKEKSIVKFKTDMESIVKFKTDMVLLNPLINDLKEIYSDVPSPSLTDLEKQKETLLAALEDNSSSNPKSVETCGETEKSDVEICSDVEKSRTFESATDKVPLDKTLGIDTAYAQDPNKSFPSPSVNSIKTSSFGTPILKSSSPYKRLPNPDNFMKDVSPVINFENLPNSTGKYEQMTEVLQKVRSTLKKKVQNCKS